MLDDLVRTCGACGERAVVPVLYGLPDVAAIEAAARGDVVLGGVCVGRDDAVLACRRCGARVAALNGLLNVGDAGA